MIKTVLLVGAGGFLGSVGRYLISYLYLSKNPALLFPYPTFLANLAGCFLIGILFGLGPKLSKDQLIFFTTGFCGGFTTFSSFSMENIQLFQKGEFKVAMIYTLLSLIVGFGLSVGGYFLAKSISRA